jgi:hypothetical protein
MVATLQKLTDHIKKPDNNPHIFTKGRSAKHEVLDAVNKGFAAIVESPDLCNIADDETGVGEVSATGGDIGVI